MIRNEEYEGKVGKFEIPAPWIASNPQAVMDALSDKLIVRAEFLYCSDAVEYYAYCDKFEKVSNNVQTPLYKALPRFDEDGVLIEIIFEFSEKKNINQEYVMIDGNAVPLNKNIQYITNMPLNADRSAIGDDYRLSEYKKGGKIDVMVRCLLGEDGNVYLVAPSYVECWNVQKRVQKVILDNSEKAGIISKVIKIGEVGTGDEAVGDGV